MTLTGKGFFIWKIRDCEGGNPTAISSVAQSAGLTHVLVKIADGVNHYNINASTGEDLVPPLITALHRLGIECWGWHYIYGGDPDGEAWIGGRRARQLGLDGYVIDSETEYKASGMDAAARRYASDLRGYVGKMPVALSSFRFPSYHMTFPWTDFLNKADFNMPQVYWEQAHNAGAQLQRSFCEFQALSPYRPYIATGSAYSNQGWSPSTNDITEFLNTAVLLNIPAVNFYSWDYCRKYLPALWDSIAAFPYPTNKPVGLIDKLIHALNTNDVEAVATLYAADAVHITSEKTLQGHEEIKAFYTELFTKRQQGVKFELTSISGKEPSRNFGWTSSFGTNNRKGTDTLGIIDGLISYHYSSII